MLRERLKERSEEGMMAEPESRGDRREDLKTSRGLLVAHPQRRDSGA